MGFKPPRVHMICPQGGVHKIYDIPSDWPKWNSKVPAGYNASFRMSDDCNVPLSICPHLPWFQLEFSEGATFPFIEASDFGILGLGTLQYTSQYHDKETAHAAAWPVDIQFGVQKDVPHVTDLSFITDFDASGDEGSFYSGHLEQIAYACSNLQRLNLESCLKCLRNLRGLHMIMKHCQNLEGLNILCIPSMEVECCTELWKILSKAKLTHLALECCVLFKRDALSTSLVNLYQKFVNLQALECHNSSNCLPYKTTREVVKVLLYFPSLKYCRLYNIHYLDAQDVLTHTKGLLCCRFDLRSFHSATLQSFPLPQDFKLQQLCIDCGGFDVCDSFMENVSSHGGLVHVLLHVRSVTVSGFTTLVRNSSKLLTMCVFARQPVCGESERADLQNIGSAFIKQYFHRKLFTVGIYKVVDEFKKCFDSYINSHDSARYFDTFLKDTDLLPLWMKRHLPV